MTLNLIDHESASFSASSLSMIMIFPHKAYNRKRMTNYDKYQ